MVESPYSRVDFIDLLKDVCKDDVLLEEFIVEWEVALLKFKMAEEFLMNMRLVGNLDAESLSFFGFEDDESFVKWLSGFYRWINEHGVPE